MGTVISTEWVVVVPADVVGVILELLKLKDVSRVARTCRRMRHMASTTIAKKHWRAPISGKEFLSYVERAVIEHMEEQRAAWRADRWIRIGFVATPTEHSGSYVLALSATPSTMRPTATVLDPALPLIPDDEWWFVLDVAQSTRDCLRSENSRRRHREKSMSLIQEVLLEYAGKAASPYPLVDLDTAHRILAARKQCTNHQRAAGAYLRWYASQTSELAKQRKADTLWGTSGWFTYWSCARALLADNPKEKRLGRWFREIVLPMSTELLATPDIEAPSVECPGAPERDIAPQKARKKRTP
jgi:hypothetical protein